MIDNIKEKISDFFARDSTDSNLKISSRQKLVFKVVSVVVVGGVFILMTIVKEKTVKKEVIEEMPIVKIDLPDKGLDTEKHWREFHEAQRAADRAMFDEKMKERKEEQTRLLSGANSKFEDDLKATKEKLELASRELASASLELKKVTTEQLEDQESKFEESAMAIQDFGGEVAFDMPKSTENYMPENTYFTGHLLTGIVISTAVNTADENPVPVTIQLTNRGNLHKDNQIKNISKCTISGSSKGDISSERVTIRLEKMVCEENGSYITTQLVGQIYGPDGFNGIKGKVISTSSKHLKNALVGSMISGFSSSLKSNESMILSSGGLLSTEKKGPKDALQMGALSGSSNAGEKIADYYLNQAISMSPVLTIPPGIRVNAMLNKGCYVGEVGVHKKVISEKR